MPVLVDERADPGLDARVARELHGVLHVPERLQDEGVIGPVDPGAVLDCSPPVGSNPCGLVVKNRERKRERFLTPDEFRRLGRALRYPGEDDFIVLGDVNADCRYASEEQLDGIEISGPDYVWIVPHNADVCCRALTKAPAPITRLSGNTKSPFAWATAYGPSSRWSSRRILRPMPTASCATPSGILCP